MTPDNSGGLCVTPDTGEIVWVYDSQLFTAESSRGKDLAWFLDGFPAGTGSEFTYKVNDKKNRGSNYHLLIVMERSLLLPKSRSWIILDRCNQEPSQPDPDSDPVPAPEPDPQPDPKPDPGLKDCTIDNSCEDGTITPSGGGYGELEAAEEVTIIGFPDVGFDLSLAAGDKDIAPPDQEGYSTAMIDSGGKLFSRSGDLTLAGADNQYRVFSGGAHLVVLIIDNAPAISDRIGRSDLGDNDLIAYGTVVVDGDITISVDYQFFEWSLFSDLSSRSEDFNTPKSVTHQVEPIGYDPFTGSCFIHSATMQHITRSSNF